MNVFLSDGMKAERIDYFVLSERIFDLWPIFQSGILLIILANYEIGSPFYPELAWQSISFFLAKTIQRILGMVEKT